MGGCQGCLNNTIYLTESEKKLRQDETSKEHRVGSVKDLVTNKDNYQKQLPEKNDAMCSRAACHSAKGSRALVLDTERTASRVLRRDPREALHNLHFTPALFRRKRSLTQLRSAIILIGLRLRALSRSVRKFSTP